MSFSSNRKMWRKTTCKGCGYVQETRTSYYLDKKEWQLNHPNYHWQKELLGMVVPKVSNKKVG